MTKYSLKSEDQTFVFFSKKSPFESVMHRKVNLVGCEVEECSLKILSLFMDVF